MIRSRTVAAALACATISAAAAAEPDAAKLMAVLVTIRGNPAGDPRCLQTAIEGFLGGRGFPVAWSPGTSRPAGPRNPGVILVDVDFSRRERARITFDAAGADALVREVPIERGLDEIGCEAVADVIESAVLAIATRPTDPAPSPPPLVPAPTAALLAPSVLVARTRPPDAAFGSSRYALALGYSAEMMVWGIAQSGVEVALGMPPRGRARSWMKVAYAFPVTVAADLAAARWQSLSLWPLGFSAASHGRGAWVEVSTWFGFDLVWFERLAVPGGPPVTSDSRFEPQLRVAWEVGGGYRLTESLAAFMSLRFSLGPLVLLEADLQNGQRTTLFENWSLCRPGLVAGARW